VDWEIYHLEGQSPILPAHLPKVTIENLSKMKTENPCIFHSQAIHLVNKVERMIVPIPASSCQPVDRQYLQMAGNNSPSSHHLPVISASSHHLPDYLSQPQDLLQKYWCQYGSAVYTIEFSSLSSRPKYQDKICYKK
jgi:hypothetical protein